jgi:hypothetical protein
MVIDYVIIGVMKPVNLDELFDVVTKIVASPHTAIVEHDKRRAIQVFLAFDDFLIDHLEGYCGDDCQFDFGAYAADQLDILEGK